MNVLRPTDSQQGWKIRIAGQAFSAQAEGEGALLTDRTAEPFRGAPFEPAEEIRLYAGELPNLFAFRRKQVPPLAFDEATVLVWRDGKWVAHRLPFRPFFPHAFLEWEGTALLVDSMVQATGWATSSVLTELSELNGTVFTQVSTSGKISHPTLGLDPDFMAWGASSADHTLTLVGTYGVRPSGKTPPEFGTRDIVVMRRHGKGPFKPTIILKANGALSQSSRTKVREFGAAALLWPPPVRDDGTPVADAPTEGGDELAWKGRGAYVYRLTDEETTAFRFRSSSEQDCRVRDAALVGENVYAIVECPKRLGRVVRAVHEGEPECFQLPVLPELGACDPIEIIGKAPDDPWILARCTPKQGPQSDAIFRRGHAQEPLRAPLSTSGLP